MSDKTAQEERSMFEDVMLTFAERFDAIFEGPRLEIADEIFAPTFAGHLPLLPVVDLDGWKHYVANLYTGISNLTEEINEVILGEDRLVLRATYKGLHDGPLFRIQATGSPVTFEGIGIFRFDENGLVAESWEVVDLMGLLAQMGGFPSSGS
jgi:predicted ester cyclase